MQAKGYIYYRLGKEGIENKTSTVDDIIEELGSFEYLRQGVIDSLNKVDCDLFSGKEFLEMVKSGVIIDDDGMLCNVYVNGFISNLGLSEGHFNQGNFMVTAEVWEKICNKCDVVVDWANK